MGWGLREERGDDDRCFGMVCTVDCSIEIIMMERIKVLIYINILNKNILEPYIIIYDQYYQQSTTHWRRSNNCLWILI